MPVTPEWGTALQRGAPGLCCTTPTQPLCLQASTVGMSYWLRSRPIIIRSLNGYFFNDIYMPSTQSCTLFINTCYASDLSSSLKQEMGSNPQPRISPTNGMPYYESLINKRGRKLISQLLRNVFLPEQKNKSSFFFYSPISYCKGHKAIQNV